MTTEPTNQELAEVARRAAEIIQQRGKATGTHEDAQGRVCAIGALGVATGGAAYGSVGIIVRWELARRCIATLAERRPNARLATWSDLPTTTEADIANVFLRVADDLAEDADA